MTGNLTAPDEPDDPRLRGGRPEPGGASRPSSEVFAADWDGGPIRTRADSRPAWCGARGPSRLWSASSTRPVAASPSRTRRWAPGHRVGPGGSQPPGRARRGGDDREPRVGHRPRRPVPCRSPGGDRSRLGAGPLHPRQGRSWPTARRPSSDRRTSRPSSLDDNRELGIITDDPGGGRAGRRDAGRRLCPAAASVARPATVRAPRGWHRRRSRSGPDRARR